MVHKLFGFLALFAALGVGFVAVRALSAQAQGGMTGMMSMMADCPMMQSVRQGPAAALQHRQELGLTDEQVQRLEALQTVAPAPGAMATRMQAVHAKMNSAAEGQAFDEDAARAAFQEMNELHTEMGVAMLRTRHAVRQVLTPEQGEKLGALGRSGMMGGMHGMMGGGMMQTMEHCPMMRGGMMGGNHGMKQEG